MLARLGDSPGIKDVLCKLARATFGIDETASGSTGECAEPAQ